MNRVEQSLYFCPECKGEMKPEKVSECTIPRVACSNEDCFAYGIGWNIDILDRNELNQAQKLMEILEDA